MPDNIDPIATALVISIIILVIALITILVLGSKIKEARSASADSVTQFELTIQTLQINLQSKAQELYQTWMQRDCESIRKNEREVALQAASNLLEQWKYESEIFIRNDAIQRSHSVILGQVTEHLVPYMPEFSFNPKDVRFVGSPIDLIVFDGMDADDLQQLVFIEVKTGASAALTKRERKIRDIINAGRVKWLELRIPRESRVESAKAEESIGAHVSAETEVAITQKRDIAVKEFGEMIIKTLHEKQAVGDLLFAKLSNFTSASAATEALKREATRAWWRDSRESALKSLYEFILSDSSSIPFITDILTEDA